MPSGPHSPGLCYTLPVVSPHKVSPLLWRRELGEGWEVQDLTAEVVSRGRQLFDLPHERRDLLHARPAVRVLSSILPSEHREIRSSPERSGPVREIPVVSSHHVRPADDQRAERREGVQQIERQSDLSKEDPEFLG